MSSPQGYAAQTRTVAVATSRKSLTAWRHSDGVQAIFWAGPAFLYLAFFIAYPFIMSLYLSVSSARVGSPEWHFVGLLNFQRIFADPVFWQTVRNSFVFTFASELIRLVIGLPHWASFVQAWALDRLPGRLMTLDNVRSMQVPNVCSDPAAVPAGLVPQALEAVAPAYLAPLGSRARYPQLRWRARR